MARTKITAQDNWVEVEEDDPCGEGRITTTYFVPWTGGYVRISDKEHRYPQVCDGLSSRGATLSCPSVEALEPLIRREYKRAKARERREHRNWLGR